MTEQLWNHPVPLSIEINPNVAVAAVHLFYRMPDEDGYRRVDMQETWGASYHAEIPCSPSQPRAWYYFIVVVGSDGEIAAQEGSETRPFRVSMVEALSGTFAPLRPDGSRASACTR